MENAHKAASSCIATMTFSFSLIIYVQQHKEISNTPQGYHHCYQRNNVGKVALFVSYKKKNLLKDFHFSSSVHQNSLVEIRYVWCHNTTVLTLVMTVWFPTAGSETPCWTRAEESEPTPLSPFSKPVIEAGDSSRRQEASCQTQLTPHQQHQGCFCFGFQLRRHSHRIFFKKLTM